MSRYLEVKPGSISEVAKKLHDDYQAYFKKELEKEGKPLASMTDAEKKAFFNRVDKGWNAKNEATSNQVAYELGNKENKTTLVAAPGGKEKVIRIPKEKLSDYKKKGYVEAEEFVPEAAKNPYAIGMAAAMKATGDKPPLKKSTIVKAHDIAKKIEKNEDAQADKENESQKKKAGEKEPLKVLKQEEVSLEEGQYKEIDTRKGDLKLAKDKREALKNKYNAIMANQASGDEHAVADQIQKLNMSIKKQEQELIDIMKKSKESEKKEEVETVEEALNPGIATDPERIANLQKQLSDINNRLSNLDKSDPESKTKEAILKSDAATKKLRLADLMKRKSNENTQRVKVEGKMNYKSIKKSMKTEKTLTKKDITPIDVEPKLSN